jgi:long-chain fatty acid transport protein
MLTLFTRKPDWASVFFAVHRKFSLQLAQELILSSGISGIHVPRRQGLYSKGFILKIVLGTLAALLTLAAVPNAYAGGFERGTADTDILYENGEFDFRSGVTYVQPNRKFDNNPVRGLRGTEFSRGYYVPSVAMKANIIGDNLRCSATYVRAFSADSEYVTMSNRGKLEEKFNADEYALTCGYFMPTGPGNLVLLGGAFIETFDYDFVGFTNSPLGLTPLNFGLKDSDVGYRLGVGYEIPDIAFRTQLMYRSGTDHSPDGTAHLPVLGMTMPASGVGQLPQSVELKVQSGIAEDWLAFGSVKWTDWSTLKTLDVTIGASGFQNEYYWRDGWKLSAGVGHKFNDTWSGLASVTWDRGVSTGYDLMGDVYSVAAGVTRKDDWGGELRLTGAVIYNDAIEETKYAPGMNASAKATWGYGLNVQYRLSF